MKNRPTKIKKIRRISAICLINGIVLRITRALRQSMRDKIIPNLGLLTHKRPPNRAAFYPDLSGITTLIDYSASLLSSAFSPSASSLLSSVFASLLSSFSPLMAFTHLGLATTTLEI